MADFKNSALMVTGASGHLGRLAVEYLLAQGATNVIAGTRDPSKLADLAAKGVDIRELDFSKGNLEAAFAGVDRLLLVSTTDADRAAHQTAATQAAKAAGVSHIVYTSAPNARPNEDAAGIGDHYWTEVAIAASGVDYTILRNHLYAEVVLIGAGHALESGQMFDATAGRGRTYVARQDVADTAAAALLSATGKAIYDVTGSSATTQEELAQLLSAAGGKPVARIGVTGEQLRAGLTAAGLPPFMVGLLLAFDLDAADGHHDIVNGVVEHFTGRQPQTLAAFIQDNKAALTAGH